MKLIQHAKATLQRIYGQERDDRCHTIDVNKVWEDRDAMQEMSRVTGKY